MNTLDELAEKYTKDNIVIEEIDISNLLPLEITQEIIEHNEKAKKSLNNKHNFKVFDINGLSKSYYDKEHKRHLPVFALFNIKKSDFSINSTRQYRSNDDDKWKSGITICNESVNTDYRGNNVYSKEIMNIYDKIIKKNPMPVNSYGEIIGMGVVGLAASWLLILMIYNLTPVFTTTAGDHIIFGLISAAIGFSTSAFFYSLQKYKDFWRSNMTYECGMSVKFGGVIPDSTKKIIKDNVDNFHGIFIVSDVQNRWKVNEKVTKLPINRDPLVIGYSKSLEMYFLLDKFDITPTEEYLAREFSVKS